VRKRKTEREKGEREGGESHTKGKRVHREIDRDKRKKFDTEGEQMERRLRSRNSRRKRVRKIDRVRK
jgi:hypothetical protein